jgi:hypothetical protein
MTLGLSLYPLMCNRPAAVRHVKLHANDRNLEDISAYRISAFGRFPSRNRGDRLFRSAQARADMRDDLDPCDQLDGSHESPFPTGVDIIYGGLLQYINRSGRESIVGLK